MRDVHRIARWALLLAVALVLLLMASPALAGTFVYADSNEIYVLELDRQRGDLTTDRSLRRSRRRSRPGSTDCRRKRSGSCKSHQSSVGMYRCGSWSAWPTCP